MKLHLCKQGTKIIIRVMYAPYSFNHFRNTILQRLGGHAI